MRILQSFQIALLMAIVTPGLGFGGTASGYARHPISRSTVIAAYSHLPLTFERNEGQTDHRVKFLARGAGYNLFLTPDEAVLALRGRSEGLKAGQESVLRMKLVGANPGVEVKGEDELAGKSNYFIGRDPRGWHRNVPTYGRVEYEGVYRGIDVVYYGHAGELEYDFRVKPGANLGEVRLKVEGAEGVKLDKEGGLVLRTKGGEIRLERPEAYQEEGGRRRKVGARYARLGKEEYGLAAWGYDRRKPLVIDPVLSYSTYLGGSGGDIAYSIAVDSSGYTYICGVTNSTDFPTENPNQSSYGGNGDAFVAKLNPTETGLVFSTYFGGSSSDSAAGLAINATDDVFVTGTTYSSDFPVTPTTTSSTTTATAFQTTYAGNGDAFVAEFGSTGNTLLYATYLGGTGADFGQAIVVDAQSNAYVTGSTQSPDFPTENPMQSQIAGASDVFITKVNFSGTALIYSTYLGGSQADTGQAIKIDSSGDAYVAGYTFSSDFPTQNPIYSSNSGGADAFVTEINPAGSASLFSTYLGGSGSDKAFGLALDASGNMYVTGETQSTNFPVTPSAFQTTLKGSQNAFVTKINTGGTSGAPSVAYSTYLGGSATDQGNGIAVDASGDAIIAGFTQSSDFPTVEPIQALLGITGGSTCGTSACPDAFATKLNPSGSQLLFSTFLGGSGADYGQGVAIDSSGDIFVTGSTASSNFPAIAGAYQGAVGGVAGNAFVAEIGPADAPAVALSPGKINFGNETVSVRSSAQTVTVINAGTDALTISAITGLSGTDFAETDNCVGTVTANGGTCTINVTFTPSAVGATTEEMSLTDNAAGSPQTIALTGTGVTQATSVNVSPSSLTFGNQAVGSVSSPQLVTVSNSGSATLNITAISVSGAFTQTNTCSAVGDVLNPGQSCSISVSYTPTASGSQTGSLSISDNATGSPQTVALTGNGTALFSLSSPNPVVTVLIGSTSATYTVTASAVSGFTGAITLSCPSSATCTFSQSSIFGGQSSTLTVSDLSASTTNPYNFTVTGTSGTQTTTLQLRTQLQTFALSVSPPLNTIVAGGSAGYTVVLTPSYGFNRAVQLSCTAGLPAGATCNFSPGTVTPNGSTPSSTTLTIVTTQSSSLWNFWSGHTRPPDGLLVLGLLGFMASLMLLIGRKRRPGLSGAFVVSRAVILGALLLLALTLASCRSSAPESATPTGSYIITITGTLSSNSAVTVTTTVDLSVT